MALLSTNLVSATDLLWFLFRTATRLLAHAPELGLVNAVDYALWKLGHVVVYFVLSLLLWRLWRRGSVTSWRWPWALATLAAGLLVGGLSELYQYFAPPRTARLSDIALDAAGIGLALVLLRRRARRSRPASATD